MRKRAKRAAVLAAVAALALACACALAGCAAGGAGSSAGAAASSGEQAAGADASAVRIASMKGPTSVGLAAMMQQGEGQFTVCAAADEVAPLLLQGEVDVACVPANLAATLYQKTDGQIRVIDVNTLGVLNMLTGDDAVSSVADLSGRTVYMTGKGTVPEYTLAALLSAAGLSMADVDVQFKSEPAEVAALLAQDAAAVGILPQPYATSLELKDTGVRIVCDLTEEWQRVMGADAGSIVTGVTVAKASFVDENPALADAFLRKHAASVEQVTSDPASVVSTIVELGIIENAQLAEAAIPKCNVVCLVGDEMKSALSGYLNTLYEQDPASVGGALPGEEFYYLGAA